MKLIEKMIQSGNYLFQYRGQIPIILFIIAIPVIYSSSYYNQLDNTLISIIQYTAITISSLGILFRYITIGTTPIGTSGRNRNSQIADKLNTTGVYSIVRNPLYLGNYLIWLGVSLYSLSYIFVLLISIFFLFHYQQDLLQNEILL